MIVRQRLLSGVRVENEPLVALPQGTACVWYTPVHSLPDASALAGYESWLSVEEQRRYRAFHFDRDRDLYLVAHVLLRASLSRYADVAPQDWQFVSGDFGRPEIAGEVSADARIRFNLSHTSGLAACVIARTVDVGIDVECLKRQTDIVSIASRYFAHRETQQLLAVPIAEQKRRFLEYWTLKEAYVKACGEGLTIPLDSFHFQCDRAGQWQIEFDNAKTTRHNGGPADWQFHCLKPTPGHMMSVAIRRAHHDQVFDVNVSEFQPPEMRA